MQDGVEVKGDYPLNNNTLYALELNITSHIPEWNHQKVTLGAETNVLYKDGKTYYMAGRQEKCISLSSASINLRKKSERHQGFRFFIRTILLYR